MSDKTILYVWQHVSYTGNTVFFLEVPLTRLPPFIFCSVHRVTDFCQVSKPAKSQILERIHFFQILFELLAFKHSAVSNPEDKITIFTI